MQQVLSAGGNFRHKGQSLWVEAVRDSVLSWLTERYDRDELKETWQIVLEVFVIVLIGVEIVLSGVQLRHETKLFKEQKDEFALQQQAQQKTIELLSTAETALETLSNNVKRQEAAQKAQQGRRPAFALFIKSSHGGRHPASEEGYFPSEQAEGGGGPKISAIFELENSGDKDGTNVKLGLKVEREYSLDCEGFPVERIPTPVEGGYARVLVNLGTIRAKDYKTVRCSASKSFEIPYVKLYLDVVADQLPNAISLPTIVVANTHDPNLIPH